MVPAIRPAQLRDINYLVDIDLKSYDYPWSIDQWRKLTDDPTCLVLLAAVKAEPIGVCVLKKKPTIGEAEILRLGTKLAYRGQGIGSFLLHVTELKALESKLQEINTIVPENKCFPGHFDDVSQWLLKREYRAVAPILKNHFYMDGSHCDGFKFVRAIGENNA